MRTHRVALIANKSPDFLEFVVSVLRSHEDMDVVGVAESWEEGLVRAHGLRPDVIVVDLSSAGMKGLVSLSDLRHVLQKAGIVAIGQWSTTSARQAALHAGTDKLVPKARVARDLVGAIRRSAQSVRQRD